MFGFILFISPLVIYFLVLLSAIDYLDKNIKK